MSIEKNNPSKTVTSLISRSIRPGYEKEYVDCFDGIDEPYDVCLCLGDLVDYGPDPSACVRWAMRNARYAVRGNHDHALLTGPQWRYGITHQMSKSY